MLDLKKKKAFWSFVLFQHFHSLQIAFFIPQTLPINRVIFEFRKICSGLRFTRSALSQTEGIQNSFSGERILWLDIALWTSQALSGSADCLHDLSAPSICLFLHHCARSLRQRALKHPWWFQRPGSLLK